MFHAVRCEYRAIKYFGVRIARFYQRNGLRSCESPDNETSKGTLIKKTPRTNLDNLLEPFHR